MKHPDDQMDERLQKALIARFKTIHDQPDPALAKIILGSIARRNSFTKPVQWGLAALLTFFVSIAVHDQKLPVSKLAVHGKSAKSVAKQAQYNIENQNPKSQVHNLTKHDIDPKRTQANPTISALENAESSSLSAISNQPVGNLPAENLIASPHLALLDNLSFTSCPGMLLPGISVTEKKPGPAQSKNSWKVILGFAPMNTFQVVRINSQQAGYQNFNFPGTFTSQKIAWKAQAGVEYRGFQFLLHYAQVKQVFSYELATEEFVLDNQKNPVRKGIPRKLHETVRFAGGGIKKNFYLNNIGLKHYFMNAGLDFSQTLGSKQNAFWATASAGREIPVSRNATLTAGPYVEYSLNKLKTSDAGFQVQPYQVGFSFTLKYKIN